MLGVKLKLGEIGSGPAYQEKADKKSWAAMKKFFVEVLGEVAVENI